MNEDTNSTPGIKLLIVEDEPFLLDLLSMKLSAENIHLMHATNGEDALKVAGEQQPDVLLLDLVLPGTHGLEVLKQLKQDEKTRAIPVIILSNLGQEDDMQKAKEIGAHDFLIKAHSSPALILQKVQSVVEVQ